MLIVAALASKNGQGGLDAMDSEKQSLNAHGAKTSREYPPELDSG